MGPLLKCATKNKVISLKLGKSGAQIFKCFSCLNRIYSVNAPFAQLTRAVRCLVKSQLLRWILKMRSFKIMNSVSCRLYPARSELLDITSNWLAIKFPNLRSTQMKISFALSCLNYRLNENRNQAQFLFFLNIYF